MNQLSGFVVVDFERERRGVELKRPAVATVAIEVGHRDEISREEVARLERFERNSRHFDGDAPLLRRAECAQEAMS